MVTAVPVVTGLVVMAKVALVAPAATVTEAGTAAALALLLYARLKNRKRTEPWPLSLLRLPPKDRSETGADQGAYMGKDSPPVPLVRPDLSLFSGRQFRVSSVIATSPSCYLSVLQGWGHKVRRSFCLLAGGWVISLPCSSPISCGLNQFEKENNPNVRNKHAYPVHRQNNAGGIGASTNAAGNYNPCPDPSPCRSLLV